MGVRKCRICGTQMSRKATHCPHCGARVRRPGVALVLILGIALALFFFRKKYGAHFPEYDFSPPPGGSTNGANETAGSAIAPTREQEPGPTPPVRGGNIDIEEPIFSERDALPGAGSADKSEDMGFVAPSAGSAVRVRMRTGAMMDGTLQDIQGDAVIIRKGTIVVPLAREQMAWESRVCFFADDLAAYRERRRSMMESGRTPGKSEGSRPPAGAAGGSTKEGRDISDVFFDAFK